MFNSLLTYLRKRRQENEAWALTALKARYHAFRIFLENNGRALELLVTFDGLLQRGTAEDLRLTCEELLSTTGELVDALNLLSEDAYAHLYGFHGRLGQDVMDTIAALSQHPRKRPALCLPLDSLDTALLDRCGAKAVNLARLRRMTLPVPDGFVCTTRTCRKFIDSGALTAGIRAILRGIEDGRLDVAAASEEIREMVKRSPLPPEISAALLEAYRELSLRRGYGDDTDGLAVSVRSSGVAEDGADHSFAGQFSSLLNIRGEQALLSAYREVVGSVFNARAIAYRLKAGLSPVDFDFAVLIQEMIDADCAGVMFTRDPSAPDQRHMLISAVPGLGTSAVDGSAPADIYYPARTGGDLTSDVNQRREDHALIPRKTHRQVPAAGGGLLTEEVPAGQAELPLLAPQQLAELVRVGEMIEGIEGGPQDVEWAYSRTGSLFILQTRPLRLSANREKKFSLPDYLPPLATGRCASPGRALGMAALIHSPSDLQTADHDRPVILVLPQSIIEATPLLSDCVGVIVASGNPTDHLSSIAREYGVPLITGAQIAMSVLKKDQWLFMDATRGTVAEAPEQLRAAALQQRSGDQPGRRLGRPAPSRVDDPLRQSLREAVVQLHLTDAYGATFSIRECRSIHDLIRFTHEMAVLSMFDTGDTLMQDAGDLLRPLDLGIPFSFLIIDIGGGIRKTTKQSFRPPFRIRRPLHRDDILSIPLAALCDGLLTPGLSWHSGPDAEALQGIVSRTMLDNRGARPAGSFNYALAARDYLNLNARVEFHFAMLDAVCGRDPHANYIRFRFKGGGAGPERGHRRAVFLQHVLQANAFYTSVTGDLITASLTGATRDVIHDQLVMMGRLLGFSRFLDGVMTSEETPLLLAEAFLAGRFGDRSPETAPGREGTDQA